MVSLQEINNNDNFYIWILFTITQVYLTLNPSQIQRGQKAVCWTYQPLLRVCPIGCPTSLVIRTVHGSIIEHVVKDLDIRHTAKSAQEFNGLLR